MHCGGQTRRGGKVAVQEYVSDVFDEVVNDEEQKNQCGLLASVMESRLSPSLASTRIQCSRHVQGVLRCVRERWKGPDKGGECCAGEREDVHTFRERHVRVTARKTDDSGGTSAFDALFDAYRGKANGSSGGDHRQGA